MKKYVKFKDYLRLNEDGFMVMDEHNTYFHMQNNVDVFEKYLKKTYELQEKELIKSFCETFQKHGGGQYKFSISISFKEGV
jgi:hypothetical protein